MKKNRILMILWGAALTALLFCAASATAEVEPWFMDFYDSQAPAFVYDEGVRPLYRGLMAAACTAPGERDMAVFLDGFLALPRADQTRMVAGARLRKMLDALDLWDAFVLSAYGRLAEVEQLPFLREVIAPEREALLSGEALWTRDALRLYHGEVGEVDDWTLAPANTRNGDFLLLTETGKESPALIEELAATIEALSGGTLRRTLDPDTASAILVYGAASSPRGSYPAYGKKVTAYAATARLKASVLAMPEEPPLYVSNVNEPPEQAEIGEAQTVYYAEMPSILDAPQLPWLVEELSLMLFHPEEYYLQSSSQ